jgi:hypothetical protein
MSSASEQILLLYDNGLPPDEIAAQLGFDLTDVLLILNSTGKLTKKKIASNVKLNAIITSPLTSLLQGGEVNNAPYEKPGETVNCNNGNLAIYNEDETVEQIFQKNQKMIARKICEVALSSPDEKTPAGVIIKAGIYANEEATGRNEAKAKRKNNSMLIDIAELLRQSKIADQRVNKALEIHGEVLQLTEKMA